MFVSLVLIFGIALGGAAFTYLFENDEPLLWRFAAGTVIGSAIFGTVSFLMAMAVGLTTFSAAAALVVTLLPVILLYRGPFQKEFALDRARAKGKMQSATSGKLVRFLYYAAFLVLFCMFFSHVMYDTAEGIFTGASNNLGDLPYHIGAILSFAEGANFPPENPSFAGAKFSYPFIADLLTAAFMQFGAGLRQAMFVQNVAWAFALLIIIERFVFRLLNDRLASKLAPAILFFSGGLGFIWFFGDLTAQSKGLIEFISALPKDYTIGHEPGAFRWGNSLTTLFITQRSLLLGMPLTLIVLGILWQTYNIAKARSEGDGSEQVSKAGGSTRHWFGRVPHGLAVMFTAGLLAGMLPLIHLHSLAVLFVVTAFLFFYRIDLWREWLSFGAGVCMIAVPQLAWSISGSATETTKFFGWHFGWDSQDANILWFWFKNTGLLIPLVIFGCALYWYSRSSKDIEAEKTKGSKSRKSAVQPTIRPTAALLMFYIPFLFIFLMSNVAKLAPWEWDNIKLLIYWLVGSLPLVTIAISWIWQTGSIGKFAAVLCCIVLMFSGALDVWRTVSGAVRMNVFDADAVRAANRMKLIAEPQALFLNAPSYKSAVALTGRRSLMRYPGHLGSHGIDYGERERDVKSIYAGGPAAEELMRKYGIDFVLISPDERSLVKPNEPFFAKYPVAADFGQYKVYRIR